MFPNPSDMNMRSVWEAIKGPPTWLGSQIFEFGTNGDKVLETAQHIFTTRSPAVVRDFVLNISRHTLNAANIGQLHTIWTGIFRNQINKNTLSFIIHNRSELVEFLINLAEPGKLYATVTSRDGAPDLDNPHSTDNNYNELDLTVPMNRHAVICQLQRLGKSLSCILTIGTQIDSLERLDMDTSLRCDFQRDGQTTNTASLTLPEGPTETSNHGEKWLFVNGIGGEFQWLRLYCKKLHNHFKRQITGVFNRGDGILWDLIECAGLRDVAGAEPNLLQDTQTSKAARIALEKELSEALDASPTLDEDHNYIVMIAYSQGCLLLRPVLQNYVSEGRHKQSMRERLRVFTFANPSVDWNSVDGRPLCQYVNHTEHFVNERDFVGKLGILSNNGRPDSGYMDHGNSFIFINRGQDWIGHLFGTQYSLSGEYYEGSHNSKLLACDGGKAMGK